MPHNVIYVARSIPISAVETEAGFHQESQRHLIDSLKHPGIS